jgi:hypothetical protein
LLHFFKKVERRKNKHPSLPLFIKGGMTNKPRQLSLSPLGKRGIKNTSTTPSKNSRLASYSIENKQKTSELTEVFYLVCAQVEMPG